MMDPTEGALELARSGLKIEDGMLVKCGRDGKAVGRHRLGYIENVHLVAAWDWLGIVFLIVGVALAASAGLVMPPGVVAWIVVVLGILLAFLGLIGSRTHRLLITSRHGDVRYKILDDTGDASGFVATLRALIAEERGAEPSKWGQPE